MWNSIFDPENLVFRSLSRMVDIVGISMLWLLLCWPLITLVPATAAMYQVTVRCIRRGENGTFVRFFRSLWTNLKQGCLLSVPMVVLGMLLLKGRDIMVRAANAQGGYAVVLYAMYAVVLLLPMGTACWLPPLLGRFTFGTKQLCRTAFALTLRHLPTTVIMVLLVLEVVQTCLKHVILIFIAPTLTMLFLSLFMERIFARYLPAQEPEPAPGEETKEE